MRKIKLIAFLTSILSALSLLSSGFSTWYYVNYPSTEGTSGSIQAYAVEDMTVSITNFQVFDMSAFSFRETNGSGYKIPSTTGKITLQCSMSDGAIENLPEQFTVVLKLSAINLSDYATAEQQTNSNFGLFYSFVGESPTNTVEAAATSSSGAEIHTTIQKESDALTATCTCSPSTANFSLTFTFSIESGDNFRNTFGKYISFKSDNYTKFVVTASVT